MPYTRPFFVNATKIESKGGNDANESLIFRLIFAVVFVALGIICRFPLNSEGPLNLGWATGGAIAMWVVALVFLLRARVFARQRNRAEARFRGGQHLCRS